MKRSDNRAYYVAYNERYCYVRGLPAAYAKLAEYLGATLEEIHERRKRRNHAGLIVRVKPEQARAAGI